MFGGEGFFARVELAFSLGAETFRRFCLDERAVPFGSVSQDCGDSTVGGTGAMTRRCGLYRVLQTRFRATGA